MYLLYRLVREFILLILAIIPYFILGAAFGAFLRVFIKPSFALKYLKKNFFSIINASLLGAIIPGCACTVMPIAEGLKGKGLALGALSAFIMVSPLLSPHTVVLTYGMLGLKFTIARIISSLLGAIILGTVFNYLERHRFLSLPLHQEGKYHCSLSSGKEQTTFLRSLLGITGDLSKYLLLGVFIASLLTVLVPPETIPKYVGSSGPLAYIGATLIGIPVYICEGEEIPITLSLLRLGLGQGPAFTFLLGSVGTCIPTLLMAQKIIGKRTVVLYIMGWFIFAPVSGLFFSVLFLR